MGRTWRAAIFAALAFAGPVAAQDVTLSARNGGIVLDGTLRSYDGEFYRIETSYGLLTVDAAGVACTGPACPDLTAPFAEIRILGATEAGNGILPMVFAAFARSRGFTLTAEPRESGFAATLDDTAGEPVARIAFTPASRTEAQAALVSGAADLVVAAHSEPGMTVRVLALDALVPIVSPGNPLPRISTRDLARALSGKIASWTELGGPDMPLVLHALSEQTSLQAALEARLGRPVAAAVRHPDLATLAQAVARDPYALAVTGQSARGAARALSLTDSCGFPLMPTPLSVKAEDYPLSLPIYLVTPPRRLPLLAREFLEFLATAPAQRAVAEAGFVDRAPSRAPLSGDGLRLINAIRGTGEEVSLEDLKRLADGMAGSERLSLTFRFEEGSDDLDAHSRENLTDLAQLLEIGQFRDRQVVLAGFSDGTGSAKANLALSQERAASVAAALRTALPGMSGTGPPLIVEGYGEALPMACDTTVAGRHMNRRVELWLRPLTDSPVP